ncbi:MAG: hypothetical protein JST62_02580 [Bacteroidetes bacterium]|nr:hypothetical protein [Bacteroidota bacterium]
MVELNYKLFWFFFIAINLSCSKRVKPSSEHQMELQIIKSAQSPLLINKSGIFEKESDTLREIFYRDQYYRDKKNPKYLFQNIKQQKVFDSLNQTFIISFLDQHGIQPLSSIGLFGQSAIMYTLIHSDIKLKEKYLQVIIDAQQNKTTAPFLFAIFIDRYLVQKNCFQKYGTQQIKFNGKFVPYPIDIKLANYNRKRIGLVQNLKEFLFSNFNYDFNESEYMAVLPQLVKRFGIKNCPDLGIQ